MQNREMSVSLEAAAQKIFLEHKLRSSFFFFLIHERHTQRERERERGRQRHRQREKVGSM